MRPGQVFRWLLLLAPVCAPSWATAPIKIELAERQAAGKKQCIAVSGLSAAQLKRLKMLPGLSGVLAVYTLTADGAASQTAVFGTSRLSGQRLIFEPRFPFLPGGQYLVRLSLPQDQPRTLDARLRVAPLPPRPAGRVLGVFPAGSVLPENTLKFYIHFSLPMSRGEAYQRIRLVRASGERVEYPFLELGEELWDPSGTRFTLFFDPGRIKRGLKPREEFGPVLEEGGEYTLVIDQDWPDDRGKPLAAPFQKRFRVTAPDDVQPSPDQWTWQVPAAGTADPLTISFAEPLDHAMLQHELVVHHAAAGPVTGDVTVFKQETVWSFRPSAPWRSGEYYLSVDAALEDRAGNSIGRPFEVDLFRKVEKAVLPARIQLPFKIR